ncbi:hypothetical protein Brsp07_04373 [Brucella sp. NBRC 14130]
MSRGDLSGSEWRVLKELLPIEAVNRGRGASGAKSCNHQRHTLETSLRYAVAGCSTQIWQLEYDLSTLSALKRSRGLGSRSVTLAEIMADSGHYSIDSTTVRAHISAAGRKGGFLDVLLAVRGAGSPVNFTDRLMPEEDRLPSI